MNTNISLYFIVIIITLIVLYRHFIQEPKVIYSVDEFKHISPLDKTLKLNHDFISNYALHVAQNIPLNINKVRVEGEWKPDKTKELIKNIENEWMVAWTKDENWLNYPIIYDHKLFPFIDQKLQDILKPYLKHINVAGFSWIKPYGKIKPHVDDDTGLKNGNGNLAYHYNLYGDKSIIIVNGKTIKQLPRKTFIFDPNYTHSVENNSDQNRMIFYMDFKVYL